MIFRHILLTALVLQGCTTMTLREETHFVAIRTIKSWQFQARVSLQENQHAQFLVLSGKSAAVTRFDVGTTEGHNLLSWERYKNRDRVSINGVGVFHNEDSEILLARYLSLRLPLHALPFWIRGLPAADATIGALQQDSSGRMTRLQQRGWTVEYLQYQRYHSVDLPRLLEISRNGIRIRIFISEWVTEQAS